MIGFFHSTQIFLFQSWPVTMPHFCWIEGRLVHKQRLGGCLHLILPFHECFFQRAFLFGLHINAVFFLQMLPQSVRELTPNWCIFDQVQQLNTAAYSVKLKCVHKLLIVKQGILLLEKKLKTYSDSSMFAMPVRVKRLLTIEVWIADTTSIFAGLLVDFWLHQLIPFYKSESK